MKDVLIKPFSFQNFLGAGGGGREGGMPPDLLEDRAEHCTLVSCNLLGLSFKH